MIQTYTITEITEADRRLSIRMRDYRDSHRIALHEFAPLFGLNTSNAGGIERCQKRPTLETLKKIEAVLSAPPPVTAVRSVPIVAPVSAGLSEEHDARVKECRRLNAAILGLSNRISFLEQQLGVAWKVGTSPSEPAAVNGHDAA